MAIYFILAMDKRRGIGINNRLPWRLPAELAYFKRVTMGFPVLMGRKTYESIGRPLPGRDNIVLTRDKQYTVPGVTVLNSVDEVLERFASRPNVPAGSLFVIGGAEIYGMLMPYADRLYITEIDHSFEADTWFPEIESQEWREISRQRGLKDENNPYDYDFVVYERVNPGLQE